jgi:hypothetical protein
VNPHEWLHTPDDSGYHENQVEAGDVDEVYQDDELSCSFNIDLDSALNPLCGDANDVIVPEERKHTLRRKKHKISNVLYISYYVLYIWYYILAISYYVLYISYYVLDEYSLVLVLNRMSKQLKSVTKKSFGGKSRAGMADTLLQCCSSASSWWTEILRHIDPTLVGRTVYFQRDEVILIYSYHFTIWIYWLLSYHFVEQGELQEGGGGGCRAGGLRGCGVGGELRWRTLSRRRRRSRGRRRMMTRRVQGRTMRGWGWQVSFRICFHTLV